MSTALLLAEPELDTRVFLERHLKNDGFHVVDGQARPDLVLLGDTDALDECRAAHGNVPVIAFARSIEAATTSSRGRSTTRSCWRGFARSCAGRCRRLTRHSAQGQLPPTSRRAASG